MPQKLSAKILPTALKNKNGIHQISNKKLIIFDLDGTLVTSKMPLKESTKKLLKKLLEQKMVAVIGGGKYELFKQQLLKKLRLPPKLAKNLFLFPTSAASFYRYKNKHWQKVYAYSLSEKEKKKIIKTIDQILKEINYKKPKKVYGKVLEDRHTQITFSALGQKAPLVAKKNWHKKNNNLRIKIANLLKKRLPKFNVQIGGLTSIDITRKGIDKAYGIRQIEKALKIPRQKMLFIGDAIFPGGNDYAVLKTGLDFINVKNPNETEKIIQKIINNQTN